MLNYIHNYSRFKYLCIAMKFLYRFKQIILLFGDFIVFFVSLILALTLRHLSFPTFDSINSHIILFFIVFLCWIIINFIVGLYDLHLINTSGKIKRTIQAMIASFIISIIFFYIIDNRAITPKTLLIITTLIGYSLLAPWRLLFNTLIGDKKLLTNILWIGDSDEIRELIDLIEKQSNLGYKNHVLISSHDIDLPSHITLYNDIENIPHIIRNHAINLVVTDMSLDKDHLTQKALYPILFMSTGITDLASFYENITGRIPPRVFSEIWFVKNLRHMERPVFDKFRRFSDIVSSLVLSVIAIPLSVIVMPLIKFTSTGPVIFTQKRVGKNDKIFTIYKFRTMYALADDGSADTDDAPMFAQKNDKRITSIGKFLRKTRLDEMPQLWNLLKGDVTLIGPRPERSEIVEQLTNHMPYYPLRHAIKPGITGWAAINQNYTDTLESTLQKLQYDLYYIKNRSVLLDLSIVLKTINVIFRAKGQ